MKSFKIYGCEAHASERSQLCHLKKKKKDFHKWLALSPVRNSSCTADWVEPELTLNTPRDQASTTRAE